MNQLFFKIILMLLVIFYSVSCNKNDNQNGINVNVKELKYEKITLKLNKDTLKSNEVEFDKQLILNISGLTGFQETYENIYLGCNLILTDDSGNELMLYKDLYSYYDVSGISAKDIKNKFSVSLSLQSPMKKGGTYIWKSKVWDKKGKGELNSEFKFSIKK